MNISHQGIGTGNGLPFSVVPALKVAVGHQASFTGYNLLAARTNVQGQVDLAQPGRKAVGVFVDCSPKGDSVTVETEGFEWVKYSGTTPQVSDFVTVGANGTVVIIAAGHGLDATAITNDEANQGVYQVDQVDSVKGLVLINVCCC